MELCPVADTVHVSGAEGDDVLLLRIPLSGRDTLYAELEGSPPSSVIRAFTVSFPGLRTDGGLEVGATFHDLRTRYANLGFGHTEGVVYAWGLPDHGVSYRLSVHIDSITADWDLSGAAERIPDSTSITEILVRRVTAGR
jgi:hypothetical protein